MAILPAHLMRSVAGGYDNESIAMTAICMTFYFWLRSIRGGRSWWPWGPIAGLAYIYMVAAWGGYVFVINMVGVHAGLLVLVGKYNTTVYRAYSLFYIIGTTGALHVPVVGWQPLRSLEQLGPLGVFVGYQILELFEWLVIRRNKMDPAKAFATRMTVLAILAACAVAAVTYLFGQALQEGTVYDISVRIKSLFIPHTKTGNPLVDSVAEHQSTPGSVYTQYLHHTLYLAPIGFIWAALSSLWAFLFPGGDSRVEGKLFLLAYLAISGYFATKMIRLVLICAPAVAVAASMALSVPFDWSCERILKGRWYGKGMIVGWLLRLLGVVVIGALLFGNWGKYPVHKKPLYKQTFVYPFSDVGLDVEIPKPKFYSKKGKFNFPKWLKTPRHMEYFDHCKSLAEALSEPQIMTRGRSHDGSTVIIDDFREGYWWLRDNTPEDARIMAWWDYGYQITGIGNRTSIADGNTWNHEHIALLGKALVSSEKKGWQIARHLADYLLIWTTRYAGMYGDDIAKSPHMARIAGSVYSDIDPSEFYVDQYGQPSRMMEDSVLWRTHHYRFGSVKKLEYFEEVYTTKNRMMRIYKILRVDEKSKQWSKDPANRVCDAPGSWYCVGTYPPKIQKVKAKAKDFSEVKRLARRKAGKFD
jgi:dolichyl-diphosphooligosaccharide--protein glycosyltransferase